MNPKFWGMLGLAMRAGRLACGEGKAADAVRGGHAALLILAEDASENTEKRFLNMTRFYQVAVLRPGNRTQLGAALGRPAAVVLAVTEEGFAKQLLRLSQQENG